MIRPLIASLAVFAVASISMARPLFTQLNLGATSGLASQERAVGMDPRTADDFAFSGVVGGTQRIAYIQAVMIGRGIAGAIPAGYKFGFSIMRDNWNLPGAAIVNWNGASNVQDYGPVGNGYRRYLVTFSLPLNTNYRIANNTRYWISVYGKNDDANTWMFGKGGSNPFFPQSAYTPNLWAFPYAALPGTSGGRSFNIFAN